MMAVGATYPNKAETLPTENGQTTAPIMRQYELVDRVAAYDRHADEDLLNRAYIYATKKHGGQKRANGDPYFSHPVEVAGILTDLRLDTASIATALLHDTLEDTDATHGELEDLFGHEIADLVDGVTKLSALERHPTGDSQAENFRKLLLATTHDIRILLVKLADRLHNMRTLHFIVSEDKRRRIAQETMDIYAPLAGRMGIQSFREELEDLSFANLNPEARMLVLARLEELEERSGDGLDEIVYEFRMLLAREGVSAAVDGRLKKPFAIWRKMQNKSIALEQIADIFGYRIIAESEDACYRTLGIFHREYCHVPGRYKDYISTPKLNNYRSLHTTVIGPNSQRAEIQIRTEQMHRVAENGVAAHWLYKEHHEKSPDPSGIEPFVWLRDMVAQIRHGETAEEFLENTKLELFDGQVFCFTPRGRLIALPRAATALDFAYAVHTEIGNSCVGARINGRKAPLRTPLENGDEIEIIRAEDHLPNESALHQVVTGKARAAIRHALREREAADYAALGENMVQSLFVGAGHQADRTIIERAVGILDYENIHLLYADIGRGRLAAADVLHAVLPKTAEDGRRGASWAGAVKNLITRAKPEETTTPVIPLRGALYGTAVRFAPDCFPLPGDRIIGVMTPDEGVVVYPADSDAFDVAETSPERIVPMRWDIGTDEVRLFDSRLALTVVNRTGSLNAVAQTIADFDANISNLALTQRDADFCDIVIDIEVRDVAHATRLVAALAGIGVVSAVSRVLGGKSS